MFLSIKSSDIPLMHNFNWQGEIIISFVSSFYPFLKMFTHMMYYSSSLIPGKLAFALKTWGQNFFEPFIKELLGHWIPLHSLSHQHTSFFVKWLLSFFPPILRQSCFINNSSTERLTRKSAFLWWKVYKFCLTLFFC